MASLIEELIGVLEKECAMYDELDKASVEKTTYIVANRLDKLQAANLNEQGVVDSLNVLSKSRDNIINEIAIVLNLKKDEISISQIASLMVNQPQFYKPLVDVHEKLKKAVEKVRDTNMHNRNLLENALEMTEVSINLLQNINQVPETANYSKDSYSGDTLGASNSMFDAKQ